MARSWQKPSRNILCSRRSRVRCSAMSAPLPAAADWRNSTVTRPRLAGSDRYGDWSPVKNNLIIWSQCPSTVAGPNDVWVKFLQPFRTPARQCACLSAQSVCQCQCVCAARASTECTCVLMCVRVSLRCVCEPAKVPVSQCFNKEPQQLNRDNWLHWRATQAVLRFNLRSTQSRSSDLFLVAPHSETVSSVSAVSPIFVWPVGPQLDSWYALFSFLRTLSVHHTWSTNPPSQSLTGHLAYTKSLEQYQ